MSDFLVSQLKASIQMERQKQALKTLIDLAQQMLPGLVPSKGALPIIAANMNQEHDLWQCAIEAGLKAMEPVITAEEVIPDLICTVCNEPTPATIMGVCYDCHTAIESVSIEPCFVGPRRVK